MTTTDAITGDVLCEDLDGIQSCEYAITADDDSETPAYIAFVDVTGGSVEFTSLADNASYRVWIKVYSLNKQTNNYEYHEEYNVYAVGNIAPVPTYTS